MKNCYKFYSNTECEYFPCHKNVGEDFNCMFCFCPLYLLEECGGNHRKLNGIKDCSNCLIPHLPSGYDHIIKKIVEENKKKKEVL